MIGEIAYKLAAANSARIPFINGRLMHAAFFKILNSYAPALENFVHEKLNLKPFTVSFLDPLKKIPSFESRWEVRRGDKFYWRVTGLNEEILRAAISIGEGYQLRAGDLLLTVEKISPVLTAKTEFISAAKNFPTAAEVGFEFLTPVSFRIDNFDAPYPRADLIFASIADKWTQAQMPATVDKNLIRELAAHIRLTLWQGRSKKFYLAHDRGTLAFWGNFQYDLQNLKPNEIKVCTLLANFAKFAGVGRLCAQGFGQTRVNFL